MKKYMVIALATFGFTACQTVSQVLPVGKDTYTVGANTRGGLTSDAEVTAISIRRAAEWCAGLGKSIELVNSTSSGTQGWTPQQSQIVFKCVDR